MKPNTALVGADGIASHLTLVQYVQSSIGFDIFVIGFDIFASKFTCTQLENQGAKPGSTKEKTWPNAVCILINGKTRGL